MTRLNGREDRLIEKIDRSREVVTRPPRPKGGAGLTSPRLTGPREAWESLFKRDEDKPGDVDKSWAPGRGHLERTWLTGRRP